jgi:pimeloyl-ACP methyl ester carboxylesterase
MAACAVGGDPPGAASRALASILIGDSHRADEAIARIKRPLLLLHGTADRIVPIEHSRRLAAAANGFATLIEFPGGEHNSLRDSHPQLESHVIEFCRRHLD